MDFTDLKAARAFHASKEHERCYIRVADGAEEAAESAAETACGCS